MQELSSIFGRGDFLPHGYCFTWTPGVLWSMVGADAVIAVSYFSIPLAITALVKQRPKTDRMLVWVAWLFSAFIFACGITHVMDIWTIWEPDYALQALAKTITAAVSLVTAVALWPLIPNAVKIPSPSKLQAVIDTLELEVARRHTAEDFLSETQANLAVSLASMDAGFISTDRLGVVTRMNAVAADILGWPESEAIGQVLGKVFVGLDRSADYLRANQVDLMLSLGLAVEHSRQVTAVSRNGKQTEIAVTASLIHASDGMARGLAITFRDTGRLLRAEAEAHRLAAIVDSSHDAIVGKTLVGRITSWNGAAQNMFGYSADEAIGQPIEMLIPAERELEEMQILKDLCKDKPSIPFETVRLAKDGHAVNVSIAISPIRDIHGEIIGASSIARDVTGLRRTQEAVRELAAQNRQIQQASRLKSQFLANMSHELRTPLNAIIGFADLLEGGYVPEGSPKRTEFLGHIGSSGRHLLQLINDVLDLSKVEAGKFEFYPKAVDLKKLVGEVVDILLTGIQKKTLIVAIEIEPSLSDLSIDPARLKQVLYNYLSNAIKFTPEGGLITVRARPIDLARFRLEVEDSGIGIKPSDLPRLFVEFQQLDGTYSKEHQGTGLGLALTRRLVVAQGGTVGVASTLGKGSIFHIELQRVHGADAVQQRPSARLSGHSMLVIESDSINRGQLMEGMSNAGFRVDSVSNGAQAIKRALDHAYDAIMLDLAMTDQRGLGVLESIRRPDGGLNRLAPVVSVRMPSESGGSAGFEVSNVLSKPIRTDEVVAAMSRFKLTAALRRANVMVIDDDQLALKLMAASLKHIDIDTICMIDGRDALAEMDVHRPDAIILDLMMPAFDGFAFLSALRSTPRWRHLPVFIWTSMILSDEEYGSLSRTVTTILSKGSGALAAMLDDLRLWSPQAALTPKGAAE